SIMAEFKLDQYLPYQMSVLARRLSQGFEEVYRKKYGLSVADWRVLVHLHDAGSCSVREISLQADLEKSRVSRAVARLEARSLVTKTEHAGDKRLLQLTLSDTGHEVVSEILPLAEEYEAQVLSGLSDAPTFRALVDELLQGGDD
ncbi:MAG: MarR family transcriptional regulator, partial [Pseudomonadota bacterium]